MVASACVEKDEGYLLSFGSVYDLTVKGNSL
jgi:hypothetical protein